MKEILRIDPVRTGKVFAVVYFFLSAVFCLPLGLFSVFKGTEKFGGLAGFILLAAPFLYAGVGFVGTALACWSYNVVAKYTGGIAFTTREI